jgi:phage shock protein PspC (stress-responsive transcriptional regulator)
MTENTTDEPIPADTATTEMPPPAPSGAGFIRPKEGRMLAGVCAGIANRWDVDVTLVRIGAVVLSVMTGVGVVAYLATWLLTPSSDHPARVTPDVIRAHRGRRIPALIILVLVGLAALGFSRWMWFGPGDHGWFWFGPPFALLVAVAVAVALTNRATRMVIALFLAVVLAGLAVVGIFGPHFGSHDISISRTSGLDQDYGYAVGQVTVDLTGLKLDQPDHFTRVYLGRGDLTVIVPPTLPVKLDATAGLGSVTAAGHRVSGIDAEQHRLLNDPTTPANVLDLDLHVGAGKVTVESG